jgi:hypothetical protein
MQRLGDVAIENWEENCPRTWLSGALNKLSHGTVPEPDQTASAAVLTADGSLHCDSCCRRRDLCPGWMDSVAGERSSPSVSWTPLQLATILLPFLTAARITLTAVELSPLHATCLSAGPHCSDSLVACPTFTGATATVKATFSPVLSSPPLSGRQHPSAEFFTVA